MHNYAPWPGPYDRQLRNLTGPCHERTVSFLKRLYCSSARRRRMRCRESGIGIQRLHQEGHESILQGGWQYLCSTLSEGPSRAHVSIRAHMVMTAVNDCTCSRQTKPRMSSITTNKNSRSVSSETPSPPLTPPKFKYRDILPRQRPLYAATPSTGVGCARCMHLRPNS